MMTISEGRMAIDHLDGRLLVLETVILEEDGEAVAAAVVSRAVGP